jgi:hypothetical protein
MKGTRIFSKLVLAVCLAAATSCSRTKAIPYSAEDAAYVIDVFPGSVYCYDDEKIALVTDLDCWSKRTTRRMHAESGQYVFEYQAIPTAGEPVVFRRLTPFVTSASIQLVDVSTAQVRLQPGEYDIRVSATTPSGEVIQGPHKRPLHICRRELRAVLTSDKPSYIPGEPIILTATVENVFGKAVGLAEHDSRKVLLVEKLSGCSMKVDDVQVPGTLPTGAKRELCILRFVAGTEGRRFSRGVMRELRPAPFAAPGEYRLELNCELCADLKEANSQTVLLGGIRAIPGTCSFRIEEPKAP